MYASTDGCARYILLHAAEVTEWHMYLTTGQSVHTHKNIIIIIAAVYKRLEVNSDFVNGADLCVYRAPCSSALLISFQYAGQRYRRDGFAHSGKKHVFFLFLSESGLGSSRILIQVLIPASATKILAPAKNLYLGGESLIADACRYRGTGLENSHLGRVLLVSDGHLIEKRSDGRRAQRVYDTSPSPPLPLQSIHSS